MLTNRNAMLMPVAYEQELNGQPNMGIDIKAYSQNRLVLVAIAATAIAMPMNQLEAQVFTILHSFQGPEGANPSGLVLSSNTLYGTTFNGGPSGNGTVFELSTDG